MIKNKVKELFGKPINFIGKLFNASCHKELAQKFKDIFCYKRLTGEKAEQKLPTNELFERYSLKSKFSYRIIRTSILMMLFLPIGFILFRVLFPVPDPPARGKAAFIINNALLLASILPFWFMLFFIIDAIQCSEQFLYDITSYITEWPNDLINRYTQQWNIKPKSNAYLSNLNIYTYVEVAAIHTESISKLVWYPFTILILLIFSINHFFDNWAYPWSIIIAIAFAFIIMILCAWKLQHAAEKLRSDALDYFYKKLMWAKGDKSLDAIADQLKLLIEQTNNLRRGAFQSFLQRPLLKSILALLSSLGGLQLLQYFYR